MKQNVKISLLILVLFTADFGAGLLLRKLGLDLNLRWLFWNMLLALIPLFFALPAYCLAEKRKHWGPISLLLALAWLVFMPNACYMITDLIHLESSGLIGPGGVYLMNLGEWIKLIYLVAGIFLALFAGLFSTSLIHQAVKSRKWPVANFAWISVVSLLCGYGVYIGRFLRLNTWDILKPKELLIVLFQNVDRFAVIFSLLLACFYFFAYLLFDRIIRNGQQHT